MNGNVRPRNEQFTMCAGNPLCEGFPSRLKERWLRQWRYQQSHDDLHTCGKKGREKTKDFLVKRFENLQAQVCAYVCNLST
jgi:hypothetical protein